jgi:hypothetical protein
MSNRNFDGRAIIQRLQNQVYARNLYANNTSGQPMINNPQTTDGNSSRYVSYHSGAQTEYARGLLGNGETVSVGGIVGIPSTPAEPTPPTPSATVPDTPINLIAAPCNTTVSISFTQGSDGGSPITNYEYSLDGGAFIAFVPSIATSPVVITGLTIGTTYSIRLRAVNIIGPSVASTAISVTPFPATVPDAPLDTITTPGNGQLSIAFTQGSDGGCPITNYEYSLDGGSFIPCSPPITSSPVVITGLTNDTLYDILIRAVNAVGPGPSTFANGTPFIPPLLFTTVGTTIWTAPIGVTSVSYLVVGGGGGSGGGYDTGGGGGGGGGMVLSGTQTVVPGNTYTIVVGDGGIGGISNRFIPSETDGSSGENSGFDSIVSLGGSGGYASRNPPGGNNSGGGHAAINPTTASGGGRGGGSAGDGNGAGGGGGGSLGNGENGVSNTGGTAGSGTIIGFMYNGVQYGRGGRGANGNSNNGPAVGTPNTGNGARGGGAASVSQTNGAQGGSGIVALVF